MNARTIFNIIRILVILFGISVSVLSIIMTYDATSLNIGLKDAAGSLMFNPGLTTVAVTAEITIEHRGILFSFSNMNVVVHIYSDTVPKGPVASDKEIFTINPGERKTLAFGFEIERSIFNVTSEWTIIINVDGVMSLMDKNFVSFTLNYTETILGGGTNGS